MKIYAIYIKNENERAFMAQKMVLWGFNTGHLSKIKRSVESLNRVLCTKGFILLFENGSWSQSFTEHYDIVESHWRAESIELIFLGDFSV